MKMQSIVIVKKNRVIMKPLFVAKHSTYFVPTTDQFLGDTNVVFSEDGSNHKEKEVDINKFFCDFMQDTDGTQQQGTACIIYIKPIKLHRQ